MHQHEHVQWLLQAGQGFLIDTSTDALDSGARGLATKIRILHRSTPKDEEGCIDKRTIRALEVDRVCGVA